MKLVVNPDSTTASGHWDSSGAGRGPNAIGIGREVELDQVPLERGGQRSAAGVEGERPRAVDPAGLAQRVGRGQRGVAAEVDLGGRREPAQAELERIAGRRQVRRLGDAELGGQRPHAGVVERLVEEADGGRVAAPETLAEGVDPGDRDAHRPHDAKRARASRRTSSRLQKAQRTSVAPAASSAGS